MKIFLKKINKICSAVINLLSYNCKVKKDTWKLPSFNVYDLQSFGMSTPLCGNYNV